MDLRLSQPNISTHVPNMPQSVAGNKEPLRLPQLPDMRQEQFFLSMVRVFVEFDESTENRPTSTHLTRTSWDKVRYVAWCVILSHFTYTRGPLFSSFIWEQMIVPIWQGILWGLGGVALVNARQLMAARRARRAAYRASGTSPPSLFSVLLRGFGLGRLLV